MSSLPLHAASIARGDDGLISREYPENSLAAMRGYCKQDLPRMFPRELYNFTSVSSTELHFASIVRCISVIWITKNYNNASALASGGCFDQL